MSISKARKALLIGLASFSPSAWALDGSLSADYSSNFVTTDPVMTLGVRAQHSFTEDLQLSIAQSVNHLFVVDDSSHEWEWNDTILALAYAYKPSDTIALGARFSATLPVSIESKYNELRSRPELRLSGTVQLPLNVTSVTAGSYAQYFHKYDATRPEGQTSGGEALPKYTYALGESLTYNVLTKFDLGATGSFRVKRYYDLKTTEGYIAADNRVEETSYTLGFFGTYNHSDKTLMTLSYEVGSGLERPDYDDFVIYDKEQATWTLSLVQLW